MHGRQSMLACVGFIFPAVVGKVPGGMFDGVSTNPLIAQYQLPDAVLLQLMFAIALAEGLRAQKVYSDSPPGACAGTVRPEAAQALRRVGVHGRRRWAARGSSSAPPPPSILP
eukprot:6681952-Prymnesium_polylepis.1